MKECKICNIEKDISNFNKRGNGVYRNECKDCKSKYLKEYRRNNNTTPYTIRKGLLIYKKICNTCGVEKDIDNFVKSKKQCRDCKKIYLKNYYRQNKDRISEKNKNLYLENSEKKRRYAREYSKNNREKVNKRKREYKKKYKKDPLVILSDSIRARIRSALKSKGMKKTFKSLEILGCTMEHFKNHIESQFDDNMNWLNRSEWHIDHIIPISFAVTKEEVVMLNHYKNLRPMWAIDNILKSNHIDESNEIFIKIMNHRRGHLL